LLYLEYAANMRCQLVWQQPEELWSEAWALRVVYEWQTGARDRSLQSFREARRWSRVYQDEDSVADPMFFSPVQVVMIGNLLQASRN